MGISSLPVSAVMQKREERTENPCEGPYNASIGLITRVYVATCANTGCLCAHRALGSAQSCGAVVDGVDATGGHQ